MSPGPDEQTLAATFPFVVRTVLCAIMVAAHASECQIAGVTHSLDNTAEARIKPAN